MWRSRILPTPVGSVSQSWRPRVPRSLFSLLQARRRGPMTDATARGSGAVPAPLPFPNSYWVIPGKLIGGEHPAGISREDTQKRVKKLIAAGVTCIVDLTMPDEMPAYDTELPISVDYLRKPIKDHSI